MYRFVQLNGTKHSEMAKNVLYVMLFNGEVDGEACKALSRVTEKTGISRTTLLKYFKEGRVCRKGNVSVWRVEVVGMKARGSGRGGFGKKKKGLSWEDLA